MADRILTNIFTLFFYSVIYSTDYIQVAYCLVHKSEFSFCI